MVTRTALRALTAALVLLATAGPAAADEIDKIGKSIDKLSAEVGRLSSGIRSPSAVAKASSPDTVGRRLIDSQVKFSVGDYDAAAIVLYDLVERYPTHPAYAEALYYLAESLFQKGDNVAARTYFARLITQKGTVSKFYRQSLERLIELSLLLDDTGNVEQWLAALDKVPGAEQQSSVPYVRGKYYYFRKDYDKAAAQFVKVVKSSEYYFQARYFLGVSNTARGDIGAGAQNFQELIRSPGKTKEQRRIVELAHMAIGRLFYERDQPTRAIDAYLNISRRSDLFPDALFEASWVYVKNREFNKALRALELLALSDPNHYRLPEVRILEANLRIRRAQSLETEANGNPEEEYQKAQKLFESTNSAFKDPHDALTAILAEKQDPRVYLEQITGRESKAFETQSVLPEVAASWLRREPEVKRIVAVEGDLAQIEGEITEAEKIVTRLEHTLNSPSRVNIFPSLAEKRIRGTEILEQLLTMRSRLATSARSKMGGISAADRASLDALAARRRKAEQQLKMLPDSEAKFSDRVARAKGNFVALDKQASRLATEIQLVEAQLVALERYLASGSANVSAEKRAQIEADMASLRTEVNSMRGELTKIRSDLTLGKDLAGTNDATASQERKLRAELREAIDAEARLIARLGGGGASRAVAAMNKAGRALSSLDTMFSRIDGIVDQALAQVRSDLNAEKIKLAAYKQEFKNYEIESAGLGSEVLGGSFNNVVGKFYQIVIRTDVGVVDIAWSRQEEADRRQRRLTLDQAREMRTINAEFSDVLREIREEKEREEAKKAAKRAKEAALKAAKEARDADEKKKKEAGENAGGGGQ